VKLRRLLVALCLLSTQAFAEDPPPGHSHQGSAFDEGPRQFAVLENGMPDIDFETPGCSAEANRFIRQGIGQLHGFLNFESERSFRQAAFLDKNCVLAYWGMAMSSAVWVGNNERGLKFAKHARDRLTQTSTERERLYVNAVELLSSGNTNQALATFESIFRKYPKDLEAKAFYIVNYWIAQRNLALAAGQKEADTTNSESLYRLAREVLAVKPNHPVHHYVIHMWDAPQTYTKALDSADKSGFSGPGIAHLWHMAGHIYSHGKLPFEMWWSQEAAARVDHTYMKKSKIFPYWLHNHAHNNEWLSQTLMALGNFGKAKGYALNMLAQPRHPKLNRIDQYQHVQTGVLRSSEVLERGEYWAEANTLFSSPFMNCDDFSSYTEAMDSCRRMKALTATMNGKLNDKTLEGLSEASTNEVRALADILASRNTDAALNRLRTLSHLQSSWGLSRLVRYAMFAKKPSQAAQWATELTNQDSKNAAFKLLAAAAHAADGRSDSARANVQSLMTMSQELDETAPFNQEMIQILRDKGLIPAGSIRKAFTSWRPIHSSRPQHDALGPVLWQSIKAPNFEWTDSDGTKHTLNQVAPNKPAVVALVLGNCPRCDTQFAMLEEKKAELTAKGIELVAIASTPENLPVFKQMWSFDEFESIPIHGLFVLNAERDVVWQDVSAEAFLDIDFLMNELQRSLSPLQSVMVRGHLQK
jgi:hypothetical protein